MKFWGVEVEAGKLLNVPGEECPISITQVAFDKRTDGGSAVLYVTINGKKLLIGTLSQSDPQISCNLVFEKEFSLSHSLESASVYFIGQSADEQEGLTLVLVEKS
ncbi:hypothetical protein Bca4012_025736 [Brassica carinata]|uniref:Nucleoplasmin-like domain-containing protein n=1 Tax=Brassica carinata TaxID=52824 RepID=A0A8X7VH39_BRACI|nr:hypothetical protein Bca52824_022866 [Brassica carinata]